MLIPIPAGTRTGCPFTNTSRCACTWYLSCSRGSACKPGARVRASGSGGAGHGGASLAGVGAAVALYELAPSDDDFLSELPPQPVRQSPSTSRASTPARMARDLTCPILRNRVLV